MGDFKVGKNNFLKELIRRKIIHKKSSPWSSGPFNLPVYHLSNLQDANRFGSSKALILFPTW